jgi:hypothetical protein
VLDQVQVVEVGRGGVHPSRQVGFGCLHLVDHGDQTGALAQDAGVLAL